LRRSTFPVADFGITSMKATFRIFLYGSTCHMNNFHNLDQLSAHQSHRLLILIKLLDFVLKRKKRKFTDILTSLKTFCNSQIFFRDHSAKDEISLLKILGEGIYLKWKLIPLSSDLFSFRRNRQLFLQYSCAKKKRSASQFQ